jgi:signal peptidase II
MATRPEAEDAAPAPTEGLEAPSWRRPKLWAFVVALIVLDLWSKSAVFDAVGLGEPARPLLGDWLSFYCITNSGGIWGLGDGQGVTGILTAVRLIAVGVLLWFVRQQAKDNRLGLFTLGLLLAGAIGNLYDNLSAWMPWPGNGEVRDFVMVYFVEPGWWPDAVAWPFDPFPIFNLADSYISVGFILLITGLVHLRVQSKR